MIILAIVEVIIILLLIFLRKRLLIAIALIKEASRFVWIPVELINNCFFYTLTIKQHCTAVLSFFSLPGQFYIWTCWHNASPVFFFVLQSCWPRDVISILPTADLCSPGRGDCLLGHHSCVSFHLWGFEDQRWSKHECVFLVLMMYHSVFIQKYILLLFLFVFPWRVRYTWMTLGGTCLEVSFLCWHNALDQLLCSASYPHRMSRFSRCSTSLSASTHLRPVTPR